MSAFCRARRWDFSWGTTTPLNMPGTHSESTDPSWEFYDLQEDPSESYNAYADPEYQDIIKELKKELEKEKNKVEDYDDVLPALSGMDNQ